MSVTSEHARPNLSAHPPAGAPVAGDCKEPDVQPTPRRSVKLLAALLIIMLSAIAGLAYLAVLAEATAVKAPAVWALAAIGGLLGGACRGLFFLTFDDYAFRHRCRVGESSKWALGVAGGSLDDRFDPCDCWYNYALKPFVGALLGVIFALGIELGITSLGFKVDPDADRSSRVLFLGGLAGLLLEVVFNRLRRVIDRKDGRSEGAA